MSLSLLNRLYAFIMENLAILPRFSMNGLLFSAGFLQSTVPVIPGDLLLVASGASQSSMGLSFWARQPLLWYWSGTFCGCVTVYETCVKFGSSLMEKLWVRRILNASRQEQLRPYVVKYGPASLLLSKFVPGLNQMTIALVGWTKCRRIVAYSALIIASFSHNFLLFWAGRLLNDNLDTLLDIIQAGHYTTVAVLALVLLLVMVIRLKRKAAVK